MIPFHSKIFSPGLRELRTGLRGPGRAAHPEQTRAPFHLSHRARAAVGGGGAGGRGSPPRHQPHAGVHGQHPCGFLGTHLQQIGRGLPQRGSHPAVHPALGEAVPLTNYCIVTQHSSQANAENFKTELRLAKENCNRVKLDRSTLKCVNMTNDLKSSSEWLQNIIEDDTHFC